MAWNPPALGQNPYYTPLIDTLTNLRGRTVTRVYQEGGFTVAVDGDGAQLSSLATTAANNRAVIQAAIDATAGATVAGGHGSGGGDVILSPHRYDLNAEVVVKYGTNLCGSGYAPPDRGAGVYDPALASTNGTTLYATTASMNIIRVGTVTSGTRLAANPHGSTVSHLICDGRGVATVTGVRLNDVADVDLRYLTLLGCSRGIDTGSSIGGNLGGTVAVKIAYVDTWGCVNGFYINPTTGASDGEINNCRILMSTGAGIVLASGGWQIQQNHFTDGGASAPHIQASSSPTMIVNNYLDNCGNNAHITCSGREMVVVGNYFLAAAGRTGPLIDLTTNGYRSIISNNMVNPMTSAATALVRLPATPATSVQPIVVQGNSIRLTDATGWVSTVINSADAAVPDQDTASGPYIKGNRTWA